MDRKVLAAIVQQNLLGIWEKRCLMIGGVEAPRPRWTTTSNHSNNSQPPRDVRPPQQKKPEQPHRLQKH